MWWVDDSGRWILEAAKQEIWEKVSFLPSLYALVEFRSSYRYEYFLGQLHVVAPEPSLTTGSSVFTGE